MLSFHYLTRREIDVEKWDACIRQASNGLIYSCSYYLDAMCSNWDALVIEDYKAVMPLPWRRKYGFYYLYQPFLTAQLGLFGNNITPHLLEIALQSIPKKFRYLDFTLNYKNVFPLQKFQLYERSNYVLNLQLPYDQLYKNYRENIRRNIKKADTYQCILKRNIAATEIIQLAKQQPASIGTDEDYANFLQLYQLLYQQNQGVTYGVYSNKNQLLASCVFFFSNNRAYYILVGNHPNSRTMGASHFLIDAFIKDHAGQQMLLDFEGSDVRNLAFFYSSFGAVEEKYAGIKKNNLPWYVKWLKN